MDRDELKKLTKEELKDLIKMAEEESDRRDEQRKKELWGNVVASLNAYIRECGAITFTNADGISEDFYRCDTKTIGEVMVV